jgi:hypothetical protein
MNRQHRTLHECAEKACVEIVEIKQCRKTYRVRIAKGDRTAVVYTALTPSCWRAYRNVVQNMKGAIEND